MIGSNFFTNMSASSASRAREIEKEKEKKQTSEVTPLIEGFGGTQFAIEKAELRKDSDI
jgi:hypothetical protein